MNRADIYLKTAQRVLAQLEQGEIPWLSPYGTAGAQCYNAATGKIYSYLNSLLLGSAGGYCTYNQAKEIGEGIRKGAKAVTIWQPIPLTKKAEQDEEQDEEQQEEEGKTRFIFKPVNVFPLSDIVNLKENKIKRPDGHRTQPEDTDTIEALLNADTLKDFYLFKNNIPFRESPDIAYYTPALDTIFSPSPDKFVSAEEYFSAFFHEAIHSTGNKKRLERGVEKLNKGTKAYAVEEVVAELGACFLLSVLGLDFKAVIKNSAAYIQHWSKKITDDPALIFKAAPKAAKAAEFILNV